MTDINDKAREVAISLLSDDIDKLSQAYKAGFEEAKHIYGSNVVDFDGIQFYDLDLPSGTLWSKPLKKNSSTLLSAPYIQASEYQLPTLEQFEELCQVQHRICNNPDKCVFTNTIGTSYSLLQKFDFWLYTENPESDNDYKTFSGKLKIEKDYCGYSNYIIIVKNKKDIK